MLKIEKYPQELFDFSQLWAQFYASFSYAQPSLPGQVVRNKF